MQVLREDKGAAGQRVHFNSMASYTNCVYGSSAPTAARGGKGKDKPCPYGGFGAGGLRPPAPKPLFFSPFSPAAAGEKGAGGMRGR